MWLLSAALVPLVFGESPLTRGWNEAVPLQPYWDKYYQAIPYGAIMRGWKFSRCPSEQWTDYAVNITDIRISPDKPRLPGSISFEVTMDVKEDLPLGNIELDLEVRYNISNGGFFGKGWKVMPCEMWNTTDGYGGIGSCRYGHMLEKCNETVVGGFKYVQDCKINQAMKDRKFLLQKSNLCPPPKGLVSMTFSKEISSEDLSKNFLGERLTSEYWLIFKFISGKDKQLACARLNFDVCMYHLKDKKQKCLKGPRSRFMDNCFGSGLDSQAEMLRNRG